MLNYWPIISFPSLAGSHRNLSKIKFPSTVGINFQRKTPVWITNIMNFSEYRSRPEQRLLIRDTKPCRCLNCSCNQGGSSFPNGQSQSIFHNHTNWKPVIEATTALTFPPRVGYSRLLLFYLFLSQGFAKWEHVCFIFRKLNWQMELDSYTLLTL